MPGNHSLKGKRQIIGSMSARLQNRYKVSVAQVEDIDRWQLATLGIACVSNHRRYADDTLAAILRFIIETYPDVEVLESEVETLPAL